MQEETMLMLLCYVNGPQVITCKIKNIYLFLL